MVVEGRTVVVGDVAPAKSSKPSVVPSARVAFSSKVNVVALIANSPTISDLFRADFGLNLLVSKVKYLICFTCCKFQSSLKFNFDSGEECPFLHGIPVAENSRDRNRSCSDAELSESCGSEDAGELPVKFGRAGKSSHGRKKFQFDLEADFPSLSHSKVNNQSGDVKLARSGGGGPVVSQSRPIAITQGFAAADHTSTTAGSSLENGGGEIPTSGGLKRRRKRFPCQRVSAFNLV